MNEIQKAVLFVEHIKAHIRDMKITGHGGEVICKICHNNIDQIAVNAPEKNDAERNIYISELINELLNQLCGIRGENHGVFVPNLHYDLITIAEKWAQYTGELKEE